MTGPTVKGPPVGECVLSLSSRGADTVPTPIRPDPPPPPRSTPDLLPKPTGCPGPECIEGTLSTEELVVSHRDQTIDNAAHRYLDEPYHASRVYNLSDIEVPMLSVANLGGIMLHLRGNVVGYLEGGSKNKWLYFISGRCVAVVEGQIRR